MTGAPIERTQSEYGYPLLIRSLLRSGVTRAPEQEIVYADQKRMSYREFGERVGRLASGLARLGVKPGNTVGVMDWDTPRYLECFFAVPMMGAVLHTINVRLSPEQILYTINHAEDDVILVNCEFLPVLDQIRDQVEPVKRLVLLNDKDEVAETPLSLDAEYESLLSCSDPDYPFPELDEDARATTFYTTGTTGLPKGVYFSHRQLVLHTLATRSALAGTGHGRFNEGDVYMPITPMFHVHGWGLPYVATTLGVKQVYPGRYHPDSLVELIRREKVSFSHCVPTILQMVLSSACTQGIELAGWKVIIGGAAMPQALAKQALGLGIDAFTGYGMSETCPILTLSHLKPHMEGWDIDRQVEMRCKTGRPAPMVEIRIVDEEMNDLPHDGVSQGEVVVRAPWLTQGYLKDPVNSRHLWAGGWLHTGDIAVIDGEGYLKITDRLKDVIKTGGEWVSSLDLEDLILQHPVVIEAAVIGVPDPKWTERPLALVVIQPGEQISEAELKAHLHDFAARGVISRYGVPERIVFLEMLPKTSVGKLDKKALRQLYPE
ncbi:MAG: fatty acid--CoA ligase [Alphaproteobacteria bacterium]|nr:fatty acid--CoA ligase [Alphaproteobacteria bacterium]